MILATATPDGLPSARVVLLKGLDEKGFVFFTNLTSRKSIELQKNPHAAMCFYWEDIHYQIRVEGETQIVAAMESDAYFASRPRGSQIGAWASKQSQVLSERADLELRIEKYEEKFSGIEVPRPDFWSGFRLIPTMIEFWRRRDSRLHERLIYTKKDNQWSHKFLYP